MDSHQQGHLRPFDTRQDHQPPCLLFRLSFCSCLIADYVVMQDSHTALNTKACRCWHHVQLPITAGSNVSLFAISHMAYCVYRR